jgi:hypothetical protein
MDLSLLLQGSALEEQAAPSGNDTAPGKEQLEPFIYESSIANHFKFGLNSAIKFLLTGPSKTPSPVWWYLDQHGNEVGPVSASTMLQLWDNWTINVSNYACGVRCPSDADNPGKVILIKPPRSFFRMFRQLITFVRLGGCYQPVTMEDITNNQVTQGWSDPYLYAQTKLGWQPSTDLALLMQQGTRGGKQQKAAQQQQAQQQAQQQRQAQQQAQQQQQVQQQAAAGQQQVLVPVALAQQHPAGAPLQLIQVTKGGTTVLHALPAQHAEPLQPAPEEEWGVPLQYTTEHEDASYLIQQTPEGAYLMNHYSHVGAMTGQPSAYYLPEGGMLQAAMPADMEGQPARHSLMYGTLAGGSMQQQQMMVSTAAVCQPVLVWCGCDVRDRLILVMARAHCCCALV